MDPDQNPAGNQPTTPTEPTQDELEWADAARNFNEDGTGEEPSNEPAKPKEGEEDEGASEGDPAAKKPDEEQEPGDGTEKKTEGDPEAGQQQQVPEPTVRDRLVEEKQLEALKETTREDVRQKLFSDKPTRLEDADGDPIETVADVMRLQNPATGKPFTAEEAASWLLQAQNHFEKESKKTQTEIDKIVDVGVSIHYDLEAIKGEYGELLRHMPKLRQRVADEWLKTAELGSDGETIIGMKIGMKDFYDMVLQPYMKQAEQMRKDAEAKQSQDQQQQATQQKKQTEQTKARTQSDREDIFSTKTRTEDMDPEEKEWASAAKDYYEG